jgi:hypothetical protein
VSTPASSQDFTQAERDAQVTAFRLEQAEAKLRAARRAADEYEQTPEVQTLRTLQRIERLLIERLPALDVLAQ